MPNYGLSIDPKAVKISAYKLHAGLLGEEVYFESPRGKVIGPLTSIKTFLAKGSEPSTAQTTIQLVIGGQSLWMKPDDEVTFLRMDGDPQEGVA